MITRSVVKVKPKRIVHLTSAHPRDDIRIFHKECRSLAAAGYDVILVVADGLGEDLKEGVRVIDVGRGEGRLHRIFKTTSRVLAMALSLDADLCHLHDPELIPVGLQLKRRGKRVVFDAHEDVPKQLLSKPYLNPLSLRFLSLGFSVFEKYACSRFNGIIAATPIIRDKFLGINPNSIDINNYPIIAELDSDLPWSEKAAEVCYVGGITKIRGINQIVQAMNLVNKPIIFNLVGSFSEPYLEDELGRSEGWDKVRFCGVQNRDGVRKVMGRSVAGLVTFHALPNHVDAQPNKMFEYMSAGIPVIASNFPLWKEVVEGNGCGICVDPMKPMEIASAIHRLLSDKKLAESMGKKGVQAVKDRFNWAAEELKLLNYYENIFLRRNK